jgi:hypothetical protein
MSGWSPKYFPPLLVQYANSLLQDKVMFGSDYPLLTPDRWLADFEKLLVKPEVRPKILKLNVARLLGPGQWLTGVRQGSETHGAGERRPGGGYRHDHDHEWPG